MASKSRPRKPAAEPAASRPANIPAAGVYSSNSMTTTATFDETAALIDAQRGDPKAFAALVEAYQRRAYAVAYGFVGNREDALELAQEAFARAFRAIGRFDTALPFYPWLHRILRNACLNHLRKRKRRKETSLDGLMASGYDVAVTRRGPEEEAGLAELRGAIAEGLTRVAPEHREILMLRHEQDLSYAEIAACLGVPKGTVMSRLHAARKSLKNGCSSIITGVMRRRRGG